ncbi:hypothetical protein JX265_005088 [Neoarthrinium moseri]|uniref:Uncharacterized protein n=1 Tax=Neoarthrinium moseri TaxID=1658444 RepID=A0A9P9WP74_9PEZI|nr:hypothetical protein JX265_005088 [Neoarthrinium moseri]
MDWDSDSASSASPSQPTRHMPRRAAKLKEPARVTRSSVAHPSASDRDGAPSFAGLSDAEEDSDSDSEGDGDESRNFVAHHGGRKRGPVDNETLASKRPRRNPRRHTQPPTTPRRSAHKASARSSAKKAGPVTIEAQVVLAGNWVMLPYMVWLNIFEHVAAPIRDPSARAEDITVASRTLLNASRSAKTLSEPALTSLYRFADLTPAGALVLSKLLAVPKDSVAFNYWPKIETLRIEVGDTLVKKVQGNYVSLPALVQSLPRLKAVLLHHSLDKEPYRDLDAHIRWRYPQELFDAYSFVPQGELGPTDKRKPTELRSWVWNARFAGDQCCLDKLPLIHQSPSFCTLRKVSFVNYQVPSLNTKLSDEAAVLEMDLPEIRNLAAAIAALPRLEHLVFESSTMVNGHLLNMLPDNLKHLQLINCWDVTAEALQDYLLTHGSSMRKLTFDHCQALNLAFLPVLGVACPRLTHLSMNMKYFRALESSGSADPYYESLLEEGQVPTWPSSLQHLDIQHMRFRGESPVPVATTFFKSLVDSASNLPDLRRLTLNAKLQASWKERSKFRNKWEHKLADIFKRSWDEPRATPQRRYVPPAKPLRRDSDTKERLNISTTPVRRSTRIAEQPPTPPTPTDDVPTQSERERANVRRVRKETLKLAIPGRGYRADDEDSEDELSAAVDTPENLPIFKQRLCDVVAVSIDDQKIGEYQFDADDFLDDPPSDDDAEWDGNDMEFD